MRRVTMLLLSSGGIVPLLSGCSEPAAPLVAPRAVVHAVLDPQNASQVVLVETTLNGSVVTSGAQASNPIVGAGGSPISGARVVIFGPGTDSVVAVEDRTVRTDSTGAGVYRVSSTAVASSATALPAGTLKIAPGARYRLRVETPLGTVTGTTRMPCFNGAVARGGRFFNLDADSLRLPAAIGDCAESAAAYYLQHQVPGDGSYTRFTSDRGLTLLAPASAGDDRSWSFAYSRARIHPGAVQRFSAIAVDSNFLDYASAAGGYDPFGHDARGNRLEGGVGLFGAVAIAVDEDLDLVADLDHAIEGGWTAGGVPSGLPVRVHLYESPRFPGPVPAANGLHLWGNAAMVDGAILMVSAMLTGDVLQLQLSAVGSSAITRLTGTFDGTSLTLSAVGQKAAMRYEPSKGS